MEHMFCLVNSCPPQISDVRQFEIWIIYILLENVNMVLCIMEGLTPRQLPGLATRCPDARQRLATTATTCGLDANAAKTLARSCRNACDEIKFRIGVFVRDSSVSGRELGTHDSTRLSCGS